MPVVLCVRQGDSPTDTSLWYQNYHFALMDGEVCVFGVPCAAFGMPNVTRRHLPGCDTVQFALRDRVLDQLPTDDICCDVGNLVCADAGYKQLAFFKVLQEAGLDCSASGQCVVQLTRLHSTDASPLGPPAR